MTLAMYRSPRLAPPTVAALVFMLCVAFDGVRISADDPVTSAVRYNREIVRILERRCVVCHDDGGISIPLDSYHAVREWARPIREEILMRRMPPWPAAGGVRPLANDHSLSTREMAIITAWVDGGTPRGEPSDLPPPKPAVEWPAGTPDAAIAVPPQTFTADGTPQVVRTKLSPKLPGERWLRGFDIVPGERRALRSAFLFLESADGGEQWLGGWTPWYAMTNAPAPAPLPANATLVLELHYAAWEEPAAPITDESRIGLYLAAQRPSATLRDLRVTASRAKSEGRRTQLTGEAVVAEDSTIWAFAPRLQNGAAVAPGSIEVKAVRPDGGIEPLLWVKENRADWQVPYVLREPLRLARGSRVVVTAYGENNPTASVSIAWYPGAPSGVPTARVTAPVIPAPPRR
jgi:hypothetical protein